MTFESPSLRFSEAAPIADARARKGNALTAPSWSYKTRVKHGRGGSAAYPHERRNRMPSRAATVAPTLGGQVRTGRFRGGGGGG